MYPNLEKIGVDYVQPTNRYVFPVLKSTCSYVKNSLFFRFILKGFFSKERKRYQLVCFLTRPILSPNSFGALHPQFDETVFECHFLFLLTLQVQVSSCLLPNFWGNFGAYKISKLPLNTSVDPQALWIPDTYHLVLTFFDSTKITQFVSYKLVRYKLYSCQKVHFQTD